MEVVPYVNRDGKTNHEILGLWIFSTRPIMRETILKWGVSKYWSDKYLLYEILLKKIGKVTEVSASKKQIDLNGKKVKIKNN